MKHTRYVFAAVYAVGLIGWACALLEGRPEPIRRAGAAVVRAVRAAAGEVDGVAHAGTPVDQGAPGTQGPWPVASGRCLSPTPSVTSVGVTAVPCPASQLAGRKFILICNSPENGGTPKVKVRIDGVAPVMGTSNPGDVLNVGDCIQYWILSSVTPQCISDTAATAVTADECVQ